MLNKPNELLRYVAERHRGTSVKENQVIFEIKEKRMTVAFTQIILGNH